MRLGFLLFDYFPFGGLQRDCLGIAQACHGRGHDVSMLTRTWQGDQPAGISIELFGRRGLSNIARNRAWLKQIARALPERKFDAVIGFNKVPGLDIYYGSDPCYAARMARLKGWWYRWSPRYRHFRALEEAVFARGRPTQILTLTEREIPLYEQFYGTEPERFHLLPPGIQRRTVSEEAQKAARASVRDANGWQATDKLLLLVGSGFRVKGLDRAIRALASLPQALRQKTRLVVVGQNRPGEFQRMAERLGVGGRVHIMGGRADVFEFLLAADLLVHPAYSEAAGMVLLEALTAGLPVLCTEICGYAFHIDRAQAGRVLASAFSQAECDAAMAEMLVSPQREDWRRNALAYAAKEDLYSCHVRAAEIIECLDKQKRK